MLLDESVAETAAQYSIMYTQQESFVKSDQGRSVWTWNYHNWFKWNEPNACHPKICTGRGQRHHPGHWSSTIRIGRHRCQCSIA